MSGFLAEMSTGLGLDWIRSEANFYGFALDLNRKPLQKFKIRPDLYRGCGKELRYLLKSCNLLIFWTSFGLDFKIF